MDFVGDVLQRISPHVAPDTLRQLESEIRRDWAGDRPYIAKGGLTVQELNILRSENAEPRTAAILRDKARGLSVPDIARRYGMTRQGVYKALARKR